MTRRESLAAGAAALVAATFATASRGAAAASPGLEPLLRTRQTWIGGRPTAADLAGRAVVVDAFTFECVNCRNVTPNLRALHARPGGEIAILGIHTPELDYERDPAHVAAALPELGITWPVVLDPDDVLWNLYGVSAWPTQFVFDRRGRLVTTVVGDSQDATLDAAVDRALRSG